jgi:hypothetical protein
MHEKIHAVMAQQRRQKNNTLLIVAMCAFSFVVMAFFYLRDESAPVDADLQPEPPVPNVQAPRAPERLRLTLETASPLASPVQQTMPAWEWDTPLLQRTVEANATSADHWRAFLTDSDWQPRHPAWASVDFGSHAGWEALAVGRSAVVAYYARRGEERVAFEAALEMATTGRRLQTLHTWPTIFTPSVELHERACNLLAHLLTTTQLDGYQLGQYQVTFEHTAPADTVLRDALNRFYNYERRLITGPRTGDPWDVVTPDISRLPHSALFFKPNATLQLFAASFRSMKNEVIKVPYARSNTMAAIIGPKGIPDGSLGSPNISGVRYANQRLWSYSDLVDWQGLQSARHVVVLTLFAVRRFSADTGRLPKTLSELVPKYFTDLPKDPYNGEPLNYDPTRGLIWSVGMDFKNSGGHLTALPLSDIYEPTLSVK